MKRIIHLSAISILFISITSVQCMKVDKNVITGTLSLTTDSALYYVDPGSNDYKCKEDSPALPVLSHVNVKFDNNYQPTHENNAIAALYCNSTIHLSYIMNALNFSGQSVIIETPNTIFQLKWKHNPNLLEKLNAFIKNPLPYNTSHFKPLLENKIISINHYPEEERNAVIKAYNTSDITKVKNLPLSHGPNGFIIHLINKLNLQAQKICDTCTQKDQIIDKFHTDIDSMSKKVETINNDTKTQSTKIDNLTATICAQASSRGTKTFGSIAFISAFLGIGTGLYAWYKPSQSPIMPMLSTFFFGGAATSGIAAWHFHNILTK